MAAPLQRDGSFVRAVRWQVKQKKQKTGHQSGIRRALSLLDASAGVYPSLFSIVRIWLLNIFSWILNVDFQRSRFYYLKDCSTPMISSIQSDTPGLMLYFAPARTNALRGAYRTYVVHTVALTVRKAVPAETPRLPPVAAQAAGSHGRSLRPADIRDRIGRETPRPFEGPAGTHRHVPVQEYGTRESILAAVKALGTLWVSKWLHKQPTTEKAACASG